MLYKIADQAKYIIITLFSINIAKLCTRLFCKEHQSAKSRKSVKFLSSLFDLSLSFFYS